MDFRNLVPYFDEANKFLAALAGHVDATFTFQTFDDNEERKKSKEKDC